MTDMENWDAHNFLAELRAKIVCVPIVSQYSNVLG